MKTPHFSSSKLREVAGCFATGVTVVACSKEDGTVHGMTASSFLSVSLDPALVLFSVKNENQLATLLKPQSKVGISILSEEMQEVSNHFARIALLEKAPVFVQEFGAPILPNAHAWYSTEVEEMIPAGDHVLVLCKIAALAASPEKNPLLYYQGYKKISGQ